ncbi:galectin 17 [Scomber japonicus]|uniref:galectin 17 n=1 Tax=Scomber japonicus TaxID=13676 RepID=UPI0023066B6F|nr:galectin 17 [Scomber japonicus]
MKAVRKRLWLFVSLHCFLVGGLVDSSSLSSAARFLSVSSQVGQQVVLPCSWKSRLMDAAPPACHIQWKMMDNNVFEQRKRETWETWQAVEFKGRVEVPKEKLGSGDCSLIINDVQIKDTGRYESYMVVDGDRDEKTRVFIQSVKLSVLDHKTLLSQSPGEDLVLDLYTNHSMRVVFQGRNGSDWSVLWTREDEDSDRVQKHLNVNQLTIKRLSQSDEGIYKVLDEHGLAVSTVQLSVDENLISRRLQTPDKQLAAEAYSSSSSSSVSALLISSLLILNHLV